MAGEYGYASADVLVAMLQYSGQWFVSRGCLPLVLQNWYPGWPNCLVVGQRLLILWRYWQTGHGAPRDFKTTE